MAQRRLDFGERLDIGERIDAASMIAWAGATVGDLRAAAASCEAGSRLIQPGQASNWTLHLSAWWTLTTTLQGEWDEALRVATRAWRLWLELDRVAAGYATRGFLAAYEVARARRDDANLTRWSETLAEINQAFRDSRRTDIQHALIVGDVARAAELITTADAGVTGYDTTERTLSFISDRGFRLPDSSLAIIAAGTYPTARLLMAQLDRARGLAHHNEADLQAALEVSEQAGARPAVARLQVELGRLSSDPGLVETGLIGLRKLGDLDQLDRYSTGG